MTAVRRAWFTMVRRCALSAAMRRATNISTLRRSLVSCSRNSCIRALSWSDLLGLPRSSAIAATALAHANRDWKMNPTQARWSHGVCMIRGVNRRCTHHLGRLQLASCLSCNKAGRDKLLHAYFAFSKLLNQHGKRYSRVIVCKRGQSWC